MTLLSSFKKRVKKSKKNFNEFSEFTRDHFVENHPEFPEKTRKAIKKSKPTWGPVMNVYALDLVEDLKVRKGREGEKAIMFEPAYRNRKKVLKRRNKKR